MVIIFWECCQLKMKKKKLKSSEIGIDKFTKNMVNQNQPPKIVISSLRAK